jgi:cytochrome oxidase assembly protein ShyY1
MMKEVKTFPRFVVFIVIFIIFGLILVALGSWELNRVDDATRARQCKVVIDARDDNRAIWLYLIEQRPNNDPKAIEFKKVLDQQLPALKCDGSSVPVER